MSGFFPVDRDLFTSSVWLAGTSDEKVLWVWLLGNRGDDGVVRHRDLAISFGAGLSRQAVAAALLKFSEPDPDSRTSANEGRRIDRTEDGFVRILNHELYYSRDHSTPRWRRWKDRQGLKPPANVGQQQPTPTNGTPTKDTDTDTDKETTEQQQQLPAIAAAVALEKPRKEPVKYQERVVTIAEVYLRAFNGAFDRKVGISPQIVARVDGRLRDGYQPWQLVALPVMVAAHPPSFRVSPEMLLRDGKHARTTADGKTCGATDWLERELQQLDRLILPPRLASLAEAAGVLKHLTDMGAGVRKEEA